MLVVAAGAIHRFPPVVLDKTSLLCSIYPVGKVTCLSSLDLLMTQKALNLPVDRLQTQRAGLFPEIQHIEQIARELRSEISIYASVHDVCILWTAEDLNIILQRIKEKAILDEPYFLCKDTDIRMIAGAIKDVKR